MSALHAAVARAIAEANCGGDVSAYCFELREDCECRSAAYAAIRVVLAEAQRSIERIPRSGPHEPDRVLRVEALAVLAELGEQA